MHRINGSPVYCVGQLQIGAWFTTVHIADKPQDPGQGLKHLKLEQDLLF